jgi:hypothetical protein
LHVCRSRRRDFYFSIVCGCCWRWIIRFFCNHMVAAVFLYQKQNNEALQRISKISVVKCIFPLAEIFFCRSACLSGQTGGGQSRRQTVQLVQNFKGLPNQRYCSYKIYKNTIGSSTRRCLFVVQMSLLICRCFGCEPVSPGFILPFCRYRPVQSDASMPAWSSLPTELEYVLRHLEN